MNVHKKIWKTQSLGDVSRRPWIKSTPSSKLVLTASSIFFGCSWNIGFFGHSYRSPPRKVLTLEKQTRHSWEGRDTNIIPLVLYRQIGESLNKKYQLTTDHFIQRKQNSSTKGMRCSFSWGKFGTKIVQYHQLQWQQQAVKRTHEAFLWIKDKHKSFNND